MEAVNTYNKSLFKNYETQEFAVSLGYLGQPCLKNKTKYSTKTSFMALHIFFLIIKHFHDKKKYGTFCLMLKPKSHS